MQTFGIWIAAFLTICIYSFLYKDNPLYKFAEHLFVGISAGYFVAITWHNIMMPYLIEPLFIGETLPDGTMDRTWWLILPMILGLLYLTRFIPQYAWLSRWPIALSIGSGAGLSITALMQADIMRQLQASMVSLDPNSIINQAAYEVGAADPIYLGMGGVINNILILIGLLTVISYFFFSLKHTGALGLSAKLGIWFLMVSFGASFGYTVMARISLLIGRMQFLLGDWLGIVQY